MKNYLSPLLNAQLRFVISSSCIKFSDLWVKPLHKKAKKFITSMISQNKLPNRNYKVIQHRLKEECFSKRAKSLIAIFSRREICFFPLEIFHFGTPQTNFRFQWFQKVKEKKMEGGLCSFSTFLYFFSFQTSSPSFHTFLLSFFVFSSPFSLFLCLHFLTRSAKMSGEKR